MTARIDDALGFRLTRRTMPARVHHPRYRSRDLALDWAAVGVAAALCVLAATALNRLPYPGAQHYRERIGAVLTVPHIPELPETGSNTEPQISTGNEPD
jgi:hypothetical protein